jgi:hypothetical protein
MLAQVRGWVKRRLARKRPAFNLNDWAAIICSLASRHSANFFDQVDLRQPLYR